MVDVQTREVYSQVNGILNMLGKNYINMLPNDLYERIQEEKIDSYNPEYTNLVTLSEQNIKKEALTMIALFHLNYWCKTEEDKNRLKKIFQENEKEYQEEIQERDNTNNLFSDNSKEEVEENILPVEVKKKMNIFNKFVVFIKKIFK